MLGGHSVLKEIVYNNTKSDLLLVYLGNEPLSIAAPFNVGNVKMAGSFTNKMSLNKMSLNFAGASELTILYLSPPPVGLSIRSELNHF